MSSSIRRFATRPLGPCHPKSNGSCCQAWRLLSDCRAITGIDVDAVAVLLTLAAVEQARGSGTRWRMPRGNGTARLAISNFSLELLLVNFCAFPPTA